MAVYRNRHTRQVAEDGGELGLAHIDGWELVDEDVAAPAVEAEAVDDPPKVTRVRKAAAHK